MNFKDFIYHFSAYLIAMAFSIVIVWLGFKFGFIVIDSFKAPVIIVCENKGLAYKTSSYQVKTKTYTIICKER
jgi:hypothetical protein